MSKSKQELWFCGAGFICPEASNYSGLILNPSMNREDVAVASSLSSSALFAQSEAANDPHYQSDLEFGRLNASSRAPNGRWLDHSLRLKTHSTIMLPRLVNELQEWKDAERFHQRKYVVAMDTLLANLLSTYECLEQLLISFKTEHFVDSYRNVHRISNALIADCVRFLEQYGYVQVVSGSGNQFDRVTSWCTPRSKLVALFDQTDARFRMSEGISLSIIRERPLKVRSDDGRRKKITGAVIEPAYSSHEAKLLRSSEIPLIKHAESWMNHVATLDGRYLKPWLTRIFIEDTFKGGRLYGDYQNLPKCDRKRIQIDGEEVVELDYKSLHIAMLYALEGALLVGDPYIVNGYSREAVKQVFIRLANTEYLHPRADRARATERHHPRVAGGGALRARGRRVAVHRGAA